MAFPAVTKAVAQASFEAQVARLSDFATSLAKKIEFDEDMQAYFDEFNASLSIEKVEVPKATKKGGKKSDDTPVAEKKKRAPSAYNLYIKEKMAEIKVAQPELKGRDLMKAATEAWNAEHPKSESDAKPKAKKAAKKAAKKEEVEEEKDDE